MTNGTASNFTGHRSARLDAGMHEKMPMAGFWAAFVIAVLAGVVAADAAFNPAVPDICYTRTVGFACGSVQVYGNGDLNITLMQETDAPINITAISCNSAEVAQNAVKFATPLHVPTDGSATITGDQMTALRCFDGVEPFSGTVGSTFYGYVVVNYTDLYLLHDHSVMFDIVETVRSKAPQPTMMTTSTSTTTTTTSTIPIVPYFAPPAARS